MVGIGRQDKYIFIIPGHPRLVHKGFEMSKSERLEEPTVENKSGPKALDPTIVGGRPFARSQLLKGIPRGIEVLIKKASVDPEFRTVLIEKRAEAAAEIELELSAAETLMLNAIPAAQLEKTIDGARVPDEHRRVFLGRVASAMLALIWLGLPGRSSESAEPQRMQIKVTLPDDEKYLRVTGTRPDDPRIPGARTIDIIRSAYDLLRINPVEKGPNRVDVVVDYECPFDNGEITISFHKDAVLDVSKIEYRPQVIPVSKGKGQITFHATGTTGDTRWLYALLLNSSRQHARAWQWHASSVNYEPGEYLVEEVLILRLIEYQKTWSA